MTPPRPGTGVGEVWLGYTLADLRAIADRAAAYCRWGDRFAFAERADIAWAGIIDHLTGCPTPPQPFEVYQAAQRAIGAAAATELREHGHRHGPNGVYATPRFEAYWAPRPAPGADAVVVDRMALWQIWATLRPVHKLVFLALAAHNDYTKAARATGYPTSTFNALISQARAEFLTHWHQGEQPSHIWATDRHGHTDIQHRVRRTITAKRKRASAGELPAVGHPAGRLPGR